MKSPLIDEEKSKLPWLVWPRLLIIGTLAFSIGGTCFLWSNLAIYISSYLIKDNSSMTVGTIILMQSIQIFALNVAIGFGNKALRLCRTYRNTFIVLAIVFGATSFPTVWINSFWWILFLRIIMGFAMGIAWYLPINMAWSTFPDKKGLLYGIFSLTNFFALILLGQVTTIIANPDNDQPTIVIGDTKYFSDEIAGNVPNLFYILTAIYVAMMLISALCSFEQEQQRTGAISNVDEMVNTPHFHEDEAKKRATSFMVFQGSLKNYKVWTLIAMLSCGMLGPAILLNNFTSYGFVLGFTADALKNGLSVIMIFVPFLKFAIPIIAEKIGNRKLALIVMTLMIINGILLQTTDPKNIWYYGLISGISTLSYHTLWSLSVTFPSAEFPKEIHSMIISFICVFISAGDIGSQFVIVLGMTYEQAFLLGLFLSSFALIMLVWLEDGTIATGKKLPPKKAAVGLSITGEETILEKEGDDD